MKNRTAAYLPSPAGAAGASVFDSAPYRKGRRRLSFLIIAITFSFFCASLPSFAADRDGFQVKKQPELQQIKPKKPVKIKLKRTAKDDYSWELTGDDAEEIIQTDRRLRKVLGAK